MTDFPDVAARSQPAAGAIASAPALPVIVLAERALDTPDHIVEHFNGRATIRREDISSPEKMRKATAAADAVVVALDRLTGDLIEAMDERVRVIGRMGVGTDTVNLDAAAAQGITVFNEPTVNVHEVAGHTMAMLLALQRKLLPSDRYVRAGWRGGLALSPMKPLDEVVVGVIGCGRIGRAVVAHLVPVVSRILVYDPAAGDVPPAAVRVDRLDDLLAGSDAVTLHVPLTPETRSLLGRRELSLLPPGAIVINVSRGGQIDEVALADLLTSGQLGGAGLDVFETEPLPADSPLLRAPNTIVSPHSAGYSDRAAWRLGAWTVGDAIEWLQTGRLRHGSIVVAGSR
ncbi:MAG TPA: NAD(P)-dependent oxidoreductase [Streptosporangiaceae bacterium]|nr:NAD(P)-dependent oxidoreductase [Streptosporangiaceae bacterium]